MSTWYRLDRHPWRRSESQISPVEVERCTEHCVFIADGKRRNRYGDTAFYPTWAEAHDEHVRRAISRHDAAQEAYERACRELVAAKNMKEPQP